jgi:iron-sulfur cluster assembly accessory protein
MAITVTEKAAGEVKKIITEQRQSSVPPDLMPAFKAFEAATGRTPVLSELAEKAGLPEEELKTKLGQAVTAFHKIHLRMRVVGGGCSGFTNKLDLDPEINPKLDEVFEFHGIPVVVDKRSLMYLENAVVDFHDDLNKRGFSITNPSAKSTCGCGSSFSM